MAKGKIGAGQAQELLSTIIEQLEAEYKRNGKSGRTAHVSTVVTVSFDKEGEYKGVKISSSRVLKTSINYEEKVKATTYEQVTDQKLLKKIIAKLVRYTGFYSREIIEIHSVLQKSTEFSFPLGGTVQVFHRANSVHRPILIKEVAALLTGDNYVIRKLRKPAVYAVFKVMASSGDNKT